MLYEQNSCVFACVQREVDLVAADLDKVLTLLQQERAEHETQINTLHATYKKELDEAVVRIRTAEAAAVVCIVCYVRLAYV